MKKQKNFFKFSDFIKEIKKNNINIAYLIKNLNINKIKKIKRAFNNKYKYVIFILLDDTVKEKYNSNLLNKSIKSIEHKLEIPKDNIIILEFKEFKNIIPEIYNIKETPINIFYEKLKKNDKIVIKFLAAEHGYLI